MVKIQRPHRVCPSEGIRPLYEGNTAFAALVERTDFYEMTKGPLPTRNLLTFQPETFQPSPYLCRRNAGIHRFAPVAAVPKRGIDDRFLRRRTHRPPPDIGTSTGVGDGARRREHRAHLRAAPSCRAPSRRRYVQTHHHVVRKNTPARTVRRGQRRVGALHAGVFPAVGACLCRGFYYSAFPPGPHRHWVRPPLWGQARGRYCVSSPIRSARAFFHCGNSGAAGGCHCGEFHQNPQGARHSGYFPCQPSVGAPLFFYRHRRRGQPHRTYHRLSYG